MTGDFLGQLLLGKQFIRSLCLLETTTAMSKFVCPHNGGDMPCMVCDNEMLVKENCRLRNENERLRRFAAKIRYSSEDPHPVTFKMEIDAAIFDLDNA